jgi:hypothetical protein
MCGEVASAASTGTANASVDASVVDARKDARQVRTDRS